MSEADGDKERDGAEDFLAHLPVLPLALGAAVVVVGLWIVLGWLASMKSDPGIFGDMFGAATSLFTGLAFAGVIITILLQSKELRLQRKELRDTRAELAGQRAHMEAQAQTMRRQAADTYFFQLLDEFRRMAREIEHPGKAEKGIEYWRAHVKRLVLPDRDFQGRLRDGQALDDVWSIYFTEWEPSLGPYFATFEEVLNFIAGGDADAQTRWSRTLRAQIAPQEMVVVFYHALGPWGRQMIKGYIEEFHLLRYLPDSAGYPGPDERDQFAVSAFSDRE